MHFNKHDKIDLIYWTNTVLKNQHDKIDMIYWTNTVLMNQHDKIDLIYCTNTVVMNQHPGQGIAWRDGYKYIQGKGLRGETGTSTSRARDCVERRVQVHTEARDCVERRVQVHTEARSFKRYKSTKNMKIY